jgi:hypothetical protein
MITSVQKLKMKLKLEEETRYENIGFTIRQVGIGDGVQFTSLPENFFKATGKKLIDLSQPWYLDHNPYTIRDPNIVPKKTIELWNYPKVYEWNPPRNSVYMTNAEIHCSVLGITHPTVIRPQLYQFEHYPFSLRMKILFHACGRSHGPLPDHVIKHVIEKYKHTGNLYQIGLPGDPDLGIPRIHTPTLWDLVKVISEARMLIGVDSGPAWIAACYPDVVVKKVRIRFQFGYCEPKDWVPLDVKNEHSFWDDQSLFQIYNCFEEDCGFTQSYRKL